MLQMEFFNQKHRDLPTTYSKRKSDLLMLSP